MTMPSPLVIGFGNRLRSDDGAGVWLAEQLQAQRTPMQVLACQQLTPELAAAVGAAKAVLFVDASAADSADDSKAPRLSPIAAEAVAEAGAEPLSHGLSPTRLLAITAALYGNCPPAWELLIPGQVWEIGEGLSRTAAETSRAALPLVLAWGASHA